ncbi:MAG: type II toxin-antitoxin system RelB/DinJ family antitoxin [Oscillospiraceae bacterium]|jgi:DNA-damage-inducible protein J|nr:type II toxin-antitoxin system RelB/DinJ family antitoxin [Oscillospiraceae bacterium]
MNQAVLSVRIDEDIKRRFDCFCADAGLNASVAVNMFVRAVIRNKKIPFEITGNDDPFYGERNLAWLEESFRQLEEGGVVVKTMEELEAME